MNELDEVYNNYDSQNREFSKEEYAEFKKNEKQQIYELIDRTAETVVTNGDEFQKYLDTQSKFEQYSVGNAFLVMAQMPDATQLRDYESWRNSGAYLKKYPNAVKILEPGDTYMREDGSIGTNYNVKKVYDISQVNSKQKNRQMRYNDKILLKIFLNSSSSKVKIVDEIPNTERKALYDLGTDTLFIARGAESPKIFYEVAEELAKQEIGENTLGDSYKNYCVSYMLCKKYGINVSNYNFEEIATSLNSLEAREIRLELEPVRNAMESISNRVAEQIQKLTKESKNKENVR